MKRVKTSIIALIFLSLATLIFTSCTKEQEIESNYVVYDNGKKLFFTDAEEKSYDAEVELVESGYVILKFKNQLPDLHIQSSGFYVKHWMDLGEITAPNILGFSEGINGNGPNGFADFGKYTSDITLNGKRYTNVASCFVWADTIRYNVHSQRGKGVIGISDFDDRNGFQIDLK